VRAARAGENSTEALDIMTRTMRRREAEALASETMRSGQPPAAGPFGR
jgi:hypothetical protein